MAHPYAKFNEHHSNKRRVGKLYKDQNVGASRVQPEDTKQDRIAQGGDMGSNPLAALGGGYARGGGVRGGSGGRYINGVSTKSNLKGWESYATSNSSPKMRFASGGKGHVTAVRAGKMGTSIDGVGDGTTPKKPSAWNDRRGGGSRTTKPGKMFDEGKRAGQASGAGLIEYARKTKKNYP